MKADVVSDVDLDNRWKPVHDDTVLRGRNRKGEIQAKFGAKATRQGEESETRVISPQWERNARGAPAPAGQVAVSM